jgi:hypothetical protein
VPIIVRIALEEPRLLGKRKGTYFKYEAEFMKDTRVREQVKEAWGVREPDADPMQFWSAGWQRVSKVMKAEKRTDKSSSEH